VILGTIFLVREREKPFAASAAIERIRADSRDDVPMETLCCTVKYRKLFGLPNNLPATTESTTALGPWYANVLNIGTVRLLHYMSGTSFLSVLIPQRERKTAEQRFAQALEELLTSFNMPREVIQAELQAMSPFRYAKATNHSVLGFMRHQAQSAKYDYASTATLLDLADRLAETPYDPLIHGWPACDAPYLLLERWSRVSNASR
jgi:hypothetical protein